MPAKKAREEDEKTEPAAAEDFDFPEPATVEWVPGGDAKLPPGLIVSGLKPTTLKLTWKLNDAGDPEEVIDYEGEAKGAPGPGARPGAGTGRVTGRPQPGP
jgi:hypothetical protein